MNKNLIEKSKIIEGLDIDKYLEAVLEKYEDFIKGKKMVLIIVLNKIKRSF